MMLVGHVLDHVPDHVLDHMIIALVTPALLLKSFCCWGVGSGSPTSIRGMLISDPLTSDPLVAALRRLSN